MRPKHFPDMATVRSLTDPAKRKAELEQALENVARPTPPGFFMNYDAGQEGADDPARASAPSPWANGATLGVDKAALPSATGPEGGGEKATEEEAAEPRTPAAPRAAARRRIAGKHLAVAVALGLAVAAVAIAMPQLVQRGPKVGGATTAHDATPTVTATQNAAALPGPSPSATATESAAAMPSPAPSTAVTAPVVPRAITPTPRPRDTGDDPYVEVPDAAGSAAQPPAPRPPGTVFFGGDKPEF